MAISLILFQSTIKGQTIDPEITTGGGLTGTDMNGELQMIENDREIDAENRLFPGDQYSSTDISHCLNISQISDWKIHETIYGPITCWEELFVLPSFNCSTIACLKASNASFKPNKENSQNTKDVLKATSTQLTQTFERNRISKPITIGTNESIGDAWHSGLRLRMSDSKNYKLGINLEKDPGEAWWSNRGPDHLGYYLHIHPEHKKWSMVIGDFEWRLGQGLLAGTRIFGDFLTDPGCLAANNSGLRPHSSQYESDYCRGTGFSWKGRKLNWDLAISSRPEDGTLSYLKNRNDSINVFSIDKSGLHRTPQELNRQSKSTRTSTAGEVNWKNERLTIGISGLIWKDEFPDARFFNQKKTSYCYGAIAVNTRIRTPIGYVFGESAYDLRQKRSARIGWIAQPDRWITATLLFSHSANGLITPYSTTSPIQAVNGNSLLVAFSARTKTRWEAQLFCELGSSLNPSEFYRKPVEKKGVRITYKFDKKNQSSLLLRNTATEKDFTEQFGTPSFIKDTRLQLRWHLHLSPMFGVEMDFRAELCMRRTGSSLENSHAFFQDLHADLPLLPLILDGRFTLFRAQDYSAAIRIQEYDLPYSSNSLLAYGTGHSWYVMIRPKLPGRWKCWLRFASTTVIDRSLSDALGTTYGNIKQEIGIQISRTWSGQ